MTRRTQNALADLAGLHVSNIRRYEAGINQPTIDALRNLALALGTTTDQLLFEPHDRQPDNDLALALTTQRLDQEGREHRKATLEGLLRAETRRWAS
jgi:transcriptional regulator with XRE-family HTH domain